MARAKGSKNRNFPGLSLHETLRLPQAIQDQASGMPVSRLTLARIVDVSPNSSVFRELLLASRGYGLTEGGVNADRFELTLLGAEITSADELTVQAAMRKAVMTVEPFRIFLTAYASKRIPAPQAFTEFLVQQAAVPPERAQECMLRLLEDVKAAGFIRTLKGADYVELEAEGLRNRSRANDPTGDDEDDWSDDELPREDAQASTSTLPQSRGQHSTEAPSTAARGSSRSGPTKVFIAHGKNRGPLEEIKKILNQFRVPIAVAVDEPHAGRPISAKVAQLMRDECSSAIFIFTADERLLREGSDGEMVEVWRPSENVVYELGAAAVLYDRRIVILKEKRVTFPSDFSDLGWTWPHDR